MRVLAAVVLTTMVLVATLGILSGLGGVSNTLDLLNHLTPFYVLNSFISIASTAALRGRLRWICMAVGVLSMAVATPSVLTELLRRPVSSGCRPASLTILTQNLWRDRREAASAVGMIEAVHPDVVALQEVRGAGALAVLRSIRSRYRYIADCPAWNRWCGLAIASDVPITSWTGHVASWRGAAPDLLSWMSAELQPSGTAPVTLYDLQLSHPWTDHLQVREIRQLYAVLQARGRTRTLVVGDFNTTPWAARMEAIEDAVELPRRDRAMASWPALASAIPGSPRWPVPFLPLDHVFAGGDLCVSDLRHAPYAGSDHFGLLMNLRP